MTQDHKNEYASAYQAGMVVADDRDIADHPYVIVPEGAKTESLERLLPSPIRKSAHPVFEEPDCFISYFNDFKTKESRIFCDLDSSKFSAILDYHKTVEDRSWCDSKCDLQIQKTKEWEKWRERDGIKMPQVDFAEFLEDRAGDIANPASAKVLDACLHLQAKKQVEFVSGVKLEDGSFDFTYNEKVEGKGKGKLHIPHRFTLGIKPYRGADAFKVDILLRFRISEGGLTFFYKIETPEKVEEAAFKKFFTQIEKETKVTPYWGRP